MVDNQKKIGFSYIFSAVFTKQGQEILNNEKCPAFLPKCPAKLFGLSDY